MIMRADRFITEPNKWTPSRVDRSAPPAPRCRVVRGRGGLRDETQEAHRGQHGEQGLVARQHRLPIRRPAHGSRPGQCCCAQAENADLVGMSALLVTTMANMKSVIDGLKDKGLKEKVKVIIGGAPVSQDFADQIGADGFAEDAASGVEVARQLLKN